jgi:hypothetical protein
MSVDRSIFTSRAAAVDLNERRQLFLDDFLIAENRGLKRRLHPPDRCGPVMTPDSDAGQISLQSRSSPQWNPEKKLWEWWYWGSWSCEPYGKYGSTSFSLTHYAVSEDGEHWEQPRLGLYEWKGSRDNNIVMDPDLGNRALYHIVRDERDPDPQRRYKALLKVQNRQAAVSSDGFQWTVLDIDEIPSSDESHFCYDPIGEQFVATVKRSTVWERSVWLVTSKDFETWEDHGCVLHADQVDWDNRLPRIRRAVEDPAYVSPPLVDEIDYIAETYHMAVLPYEGQYIGFVLMFNPAGAIPPPHMNYTGLNQVELAASRDLRHWRRLCDREVFLGIEPWDGKAWGNQEVLVCGAPIVRDDEIWIYHMAGRFRGPEEVFPEEYHPYFKAESALALAKLRRDGFVSLQAEGADGELVTPPLKPGGAELILNADASGGALQVEVLDAESGRCLEGGDAEAFDGFNGDQLRGAVTWKGRRVGEVAGGREIRLRVRLSGETQLYSLWCQ